MIVIAQAFAWQAAGFFIAANVLTIRGYSKHTDKYINAVETDLVFTGIFTGLALIFGALSYLP